MQRKTLEWLFVLPTDGLQGSEHIVQNLSKSIEEKGYTCRVIILTRKYYKGWGNLEQSMRITYFPFNWYIFGLLLLIPYLFTIRTDKIQYVFSSQTLINGVLGFSKRLGLLKKSKVILRESNSIFKLFSGPKLWIYRFFYFLGYEKSSLVICQTDYMKNQLLKMLPNLTEKLNIKTIPNPFIHGDVGLRSKKIPDKYLNMEFIIAAGRLTYAKGFDVLLNAFAKLQLSNPHLHLVILGEGKSRSSLENQIHCLNLQEKVHMPGYIRNVYAFFKYAKVCVLSSRIEGFPNVLMQMMSQNTNVVATLCAEGISTIPGLYTCRPEDETELEQAIRVTLSSNNLKNESIFSSYLEKRAKPIFYQRIMDNIQ